MTISEYACDDCGYQYEGCGGLGLLESGWGRQTVSCGECQALHDVELGVNLQEKLATGRERKRGPKRREESAKPTVESVLAALVFTCPVDPSHPVRPWTDCEAGWTVPDAITSVCPVCEGPVRLVRPVMEID